MRSLTTPAPEDGARIRAVVVAAVPAAVAEASVMCLPLHTVVTSGAGVSIHIAVFMPLFLAAFGATVAVATRYRTSPRVATLVTIGAVATGVLLARGGIQREVVVIAMLLLVGLRVVGLAFRDWREPIAGSFLIGALVLAGESIVGTAAPQDWGPPLVVLIPVFFVGSMASRAVSVWTTDDAEELPTDERDRSLRRAVRTTLWIPVAMLAGVGLGLRDGALDHLGSLLAPLGNALVSVVVFALTQLARPIFWLVDKLGIDPEGARRVLDRAATSASRARDRAVDQVGQPSIIGRLLGLALFVLIAWSLVRFMRRLRPEPVASDRPLGSPTVGVSVGTTPDQPVAPSRITRRDPPADRVRRWYGEVLGALARRGVLRDPATTPAEFAPAVLAAYPAIAREFIALTRAYEDVRYGSAHLDDASLATLDGQRRGMLRAIRSQPAEPRDAAGSDP